MNKFKIELTSRQMATAVASLESAARGLGECPAGTRCQELALYLQAPTNWLVVSE